MGETLGSQRSSVTVSTSVTYLSPPNFVGIRTSQPQRLVRMNVEAIKAGSAKRNPPAEQVGKFQYGTAGVSIELIHYSIRF